MNELKTLIVNGQEYAVTDDSKIPVPAVAKAGQMVVVKTVDATGRPTSWRTVDAPFVATAVFDSADDSGELFTCSTHTARELIQMINNGIPLIGLLLDQTRGTSKSFFCFTEGDWRIVVGDAIMDGGWQHCVGQSSFYADGNVDNPVIHNELWAAY